MTEERKPLWSCPYCNEKRYSVIGAMGSAQHVREHHPDKTGSYEEALRKHYRVDDPSVTGDRPA